MMVMMMVMMMMMMVMMVMMMMMIMMMMMMTPLCSPLADFEEQGVLGRGKYSTVFRARQKSTDKLVALKKVQIFDMESDARNEVINEARLLQSLPGAP